jgi:hypothetical protein
MPDNRPPSELARPPEGTPSNSYREKGNQMAKTPRKKSELRKVSVLLPPLSIRKAAAKFLAAWTEQIHRNEEQSRTLTTLRDTLLSKLLSGS